MAWLSGYTTRRKLTIDQTKVDDNLADFPVLVKLTSANFDFTKANADGFDLRFTSSDGETLLKYERERHDSVNELAEYWVKVPAVAAGADTDIYIYYRTTDTADGADPTNVWDSNYKMVLHMNDNPDTSTVQDSTSNNKDGTKKAANEPIEAVGKIGKAQDFDGSDDRIDTTPAATSAHTITAWIYPHNVYSTGEGHLFSLADTDYFAVRNTKLNSYTYQSDNVYANTVLAVNNWYHVTLVRNGTAYAFYLNGAPDGTPTAASRAIAGTHGVGARGTTGAYPFDGIIDEFRLSEGVRSAAWIKADYNSGADTLLTYGDEEVPPAGGSHGFIF